MIQKEHRITTIYPDPSPPLKSQSLCDQHQFEMIFDERSPKPVATWCPFFGPEMASQIEKSGSSVILNTPRNSWLIVGSNYSHLFILALLLWYFITGMGTPSTFSSFPLISADLSLFGSCSKDGNRRYQIHHDRNTMGIPGICHGISHGKW